MFYFNQSLVDLVGLVIGFSRTFFKQLIRRFELTFIREKPSLSLEEYSLLSSKALISPLNIILSQVSSVNTTPNFLKKFNIIRLYLIKSYRGRSHALGKPVRGQRTWSNSWNSYKVNTLLRSFISETVTQLKATSKPEKINYKTVKKKYAPNLKSKKRKVKVTKKLFWF